jgi:K+-sensing histidine kinase KdpD
MGQMSGAEASDGIGLGLPIVQAIAGAHNATLTAEALRGGGLKHDVAFQRARSPRHRGIEPTISTSQGSAGRVSNLRRRD